MIWSGPFSPEPIQTSPHVGTWLACTWSRNDGAGIGRLPYALAIEHLRGAASHRQHCGFSSHDVIDVIRDHVGDGLSNAGGRRSMLPGRASPGPERGDVVERGPRQRDRDARCRLVAVVVGVMAFGLATVVGALPAHAVADRVYVTNFDSDTVSAASSIAPAPPHCEARCTGRGPGGSPVAWPPYAP